MFTDMDVCRKILHQLKELLALAGKLVFAVDTVANRRPDDSDYKPGISVTTKEGFRLTLKSRNYYDEQSQTQFSPGIYELYRDAELLQSEPMDFQTHLYKLGELEPYLKEIGFRSITTYSSFQKEIAVGNQSEMFLYECVL